MLSVTSCICNYPPALLVHSAGCPVCWLYLRHPSLIDMHLATNLYNAPLMWYNLPLFVRSVQSLDLFTSHLETNLFTGCQNVPGTVPWPSNDQNGLPFWCCLTQVGTEAIKWSYFSFFRFIEHFYFIVFNFFSIVPNASLGRSLKELVSGGTETLTHSMLLSYMKVVPLKSYHIRIWLVIPHISQAHVCFLAAKLI